MKIPHPDHILVIDEMPLISLGLQEVFRRLNPLVQVEYTVSIFTALSAKIYKGRLFDLIILGIQAVGYADEEVYESVAQLKQRFGNSRIMIYTDRYDPRLIGNIKDWEIDACVHKYEPPEEILHAYTRISAGEHYVSGILHSLYYAYRLDL